VFLFRFSFIFNTESLRHKRTLSLSVNMAREDARSAKTIYFELFIIFPIAIGIGLDAELKGTRMTLKGMIYTVFYFSMMISIFRFAKNQSV